MIRDVPLLRGSSPSRPINWNGWIHVLVWLQISIVIGYALLIPYGMLQDAVWQYKWGQAHTVVVLGNALIVAVAALRSRVTHIPGHLLACGLLLLAHLLTAVASVFDVTSYASGSNQSVLTWSMLLYVTIYSLHTFGLLTMVPIAKLPRLVMLRLGADTALVLALADTILRLILPSLFAPWIWSETVDATHLRLVTGLGVAFWFISVARRFGGVSRRVAMCVAAGFVCMVFTDAAFLFASVSMAHGSVGFLLGIAMPFWDLHQLCWALGLFYVTYIPVRWRPSSSAAAPSNVAITRHMSRPALLLIILAIVGSGATPSFSTTISLIIAFVSRETLVWYEHEQLTRLQQTRTKELHQANQQLLSYASQAGELAAERERIRIAREIHDGLGHYLTAINLHLRAARERLVTAPQQVDGVLGDVQTLVKDALTDVRRSVAALRDVPHDARSFQRDMQRLVDEQCAAGIPTKITIIGTPRTLAPRADDVLYRVLQEALTNVRKHAHATQVLVTAEYLKTHMRLHIQDDGVGTCHPDAGYGLLGMAERVRELGGTFTVHTAPQAGFQVVVEVEG